MVTTRRTLIAVVNDLHAGSPFAVCPAQWRFPTGTPFHPNELQQVILAHWCACWANVAKLRKGARLVVIVAGDVIEGLHHESTQIETSRVDVQEQWAVAIIESGLELAKFSNRGDRVYFVSGTPAHMGAGNSSTERIARTLLDTDDLDGSVIRPRLYATINGVLFDVAHRGFRLGSRERRLRGRSSPRWCRGLGANSQE